MRTVRVRIPIGIDSSGHWHSASWTPNVNEEHAVAAACPQYEFSNIERTTLVWIEADVPVPVDAVQGTVTLIVTPDIP